MDFLKSISWRTWALSLAFIALVAVLGVSWYQETLNKRAKHLASKTQDALTRIVQAPQIEEQSVLEAQGVTSPASSVRTPLPKEERRKAKAKKEKLKLLVAPKQDVPSSRRRTNPPGAAGLLSPSPRSTRECRTARKYKALVDKNGFAWGLQQANEHGISIDEARRIAAKCGV